MSGSLDFQRHCHAIRFYRGGRRAVNPLFPIRTPLRLYFVFGYSNACPSGMASIESFWDSIMPRVPGSSCIAKSLDSGLRYLSGYNL
jgi:hypothetical protein